MDNNNEKPIEEVPQENAPSIPPPPLEKKDLTPEVSVEEKAESVETDEKITQEENLSLGDHFSRAFDRMKKNILTLFLISVIWFLIYAIFYGGGTLVVISFFSKLYNPNLSNYDSIFSLNNVLTVLGVLIGMIFFTALINAVKSGANIYAVSRDSKVKLGEAIKRGFGVSISLIILGIISGFLAAGGFFLLIFPAFIIILFLSMSMYIVVIEEKGSIKAINMSIRLIKSNFGFVLGRYALLLVAIFVYRFLGDTILNFLVDTEENTNLIFRGLFNAVFGLPVAWFSAAYGVTLYEHLKSIYKGEEKRRTLWIWLLGIIGWIVAGLLVYFGYTTYSQRIQDFTPPVMNMESITTPKPTEVQETTESQVQDESIQESPFSDM